MIVRGKVGFTDTTLEYYAEAEPRLLKLRDEFRSGAKTEEQVKEICWLASGPKAVERDMAKIPGTPDSITQINNFIEWQNQNPLRVRLYGYPGIIAALVLAPPEAQEVEVVNWV